MKRVHLSCLSLALFAFYVVVFVAIARAQCENPQTLGPTQWLNADGETISTTVTFSWSSGTAYWNVSHVSTYTGVGTFSIKKNGTVVASYPGSGPGSPYNQSQSGSVAASPGDFLFCDAGNFGWTVVADGGPKKIYIAIKNPAALPMKYRVVKTLSDNSREIQGEVTLQPGTALAQSVPVLNPCDPGIFHVEYFLEDMQYDDDGWHVVDGAVTEGRVNPTAGGTTVDPVDADNFTIPPIDMEVPSGFPSGTPTSASSGGSIWNSTTINNTTTQANTLDKATYREGVDKITSRLDKIHTRQGEELAEAKTANTKLEAANTKLGAIETAVKAIKDLWQPEDNPHETPSTDAAAMKSSAEGQSFSALKPAGAVSVGGATGSPGVLYSQVLGGTTLKLSLSPGDYLSAYEGADGLLVGGRVVLLFALVVWLARNAGTSVQAYIIGLGNADSGGANTGIENLVPGVTQAKQLAQAGVVVVAIFAAAAGMVAIVDVIMTGSGGPGIASLFGAFDAGTFGTFWVWLNRYVPLAAAAIIFIQNAAVPYLLAPIYALALAIVKFVKP